MRLNVTLKLWMLILCLSGALIQAADWPQFRGLQRNGSSPETGLLKTWPAGGPKLIWSADGIGKGYSSIAIAQGSLYVTGMKEEHKGYVSAFDLKGKLKWQQSYGPEWYRSFAGGRSTPTIDGKRLYLVSGMGVMYCIDTQNGKTIWTVEYLKNFKGKMLPWGICENVLIVDDKAICTPGGPQASIAALDKNTGKTIWQTTELSERGAYCSPILIERGSRKIIVTLLSDSIVAVDAADGKVLWKDNHENYRDKGRPTNPVSPIYKDGRIYCTAGYDAGGTFLDISQDGSTFKRFATDYTLDVHHGGVVLVNGYVYGANWKNNSSGNWCCIDWNTGKAKYENSWNKHKGSIITADGMLYCWDEATGEIALVPADPAGFHPVSSFMVPKGKDRYKWAHPSISDGRLYIRHGEALMAFDIKAK